MSTRDDEEFSACGRNMSEIAVRSEDGVVAIVHLRMAGEHERRHWTARLSVAGKGAGRPIPEVTPIDRGAGTTR